MSKCKDECADHVQELLKQIEQLKSENERLREYIQTIGEYAYTQHGDTKAYTRHELYQIATMCRDKQVEQALKGIELWNNLT